MANDAVRQAYRVGHDGLGPHGWSLGPDRHVQHDPGSGTGRVGQIGLYRAGIFAASDGLRATAVRSQRLPAETLPVAR